MPDLFVQIQTYQLNSSLNHLQISQHSSRRLHRESVYFSSLSKRYIRWDSYEQSWLSHLNRCRCIATRIRRSAVNRSTYRTIMLTTCRRRRSSFKEATIYHRLRRRCNCNVTPRVRAIRPSKLRRRRHWTFANRETGIVIWRIIGPPRTGDTLVFRWRNFAWLTTSPHDTNT